MKGQFNAITAQGRTGPSMPTGIVIQDCRVMADPLLDKVAIKTYLGRPWKQYARTVFMESDIGDMVAPEGYNPFDGKDGPNTAESFYGEYMNTGAGAKVEARAKWPLVKPNLTLEVAQTYTGAAFLPGAEAWLKPTGVPFYLGFKP